MLCNNNNNNGKIYVVDNNNKIAAYIFVFVSTTFKEYGKKVPRIIYYLENKNEKKNTYFA